MNLNHVSSDETTTVHVNSEIAIGPLAAWSLRPFFSLVLNAFRLACVLHVLS